MPESGMAGWKLRHRQMWDTSGHSLTTGGIYGNKEYQS